MESTSKRQDWGLLLLRLLVGWVFLSEGIQKFLFPAALGPGRFAKIGIPIPNFSGPFVGIVEIVCGALLIAGLWTPVVAAVSGYCLGGGCELALSCDLIVASETAEFGQPETGLGIIPGAGGTQLLTRAVGKALAMDVILSGRRLSAREALQAGLVARVVAKEAWLEEAKRVARDIAEQGPVATRLAKESVDRAYETTLSAGLEAERRALYLAFASEDAHEGLTAFTEKRKPEFKGR